MQRAATPLPRSFPTCVHYPYTCSYVYTRIAICRVSYASYAYTLLNDTTLMSLGSRAEFDVGGHSG